MEPSLVFVLPDGTLQTIPLAAEEGATEITIGRADDNTVEIDHPAVSRHHLRLVRRGPDVNDESGAPPAAAVRWWAEDTRSANGTIHNGIPLGPTAPVALSDGDCLAFGPDPAAVRAVYLHPCEPVTDPGSDGFPAVGATLGKRYRLEEDLGGTQEFQNCRATDASADGEPVLVKVFRPGALPGDSFPVLVARVDRLRAIPSHLGVVRCLDAGRDGDHAFVAARWVQGFPTLDLLRTRGALTLTEALGLLGSAAAASDHVAAHGLAPLDLSLRATLLAFHPPLTDGVNEWERLRHVPLERWPVFTPRFAVSLLAPLAGTGERLAALALFACELLGRPLPDGARGRPPRIVHPALGEAGNALLRQVLAVTKPPSDGASEESAAAFANGRAFVTALTHAAGLGPTSGG